jgi:hypothetical protein
MILTPRASATLVVDVVVRIFQIGQTTLEEAVLARCIRTQQVGEQPLYIGMLRDKRLLATNSEETSSGCQVHRFARISSISRWMSTQV